MMIQNSFSTAYTHNLRVLTMAPCSSKIKGYKGVITYVQKRGLKKMIYGYARVSTRQQDLEGQLRQLEEERCARGYAGCNEAGPLRSQHARCIEHD